MCVFERERKVEVKREIVRKKKKRRKKRGGEGEVKTFGLSKVVKNNKRK